MFIDTSRLHDLRRLDALLNDDTKPMHLKRRVWRTKQKILGQLFNPRLAKERERLYLATLAGDRREMWKITNIIQDITHQEKLDEGTM